MQDACDRKTPEERMVRDTKRIYGEAWQRTADKFRDIYPPLVLYSCGDLLWSLAGFPVGLNSG